MFKFFKSKVGFTLVELLVVVLIIGIVVAIGIPTYRGIAKSNRKKICTVQRREILAELKDWCNNEDFNDNYTFTITSDGTKGTVVAEKFEETITKNGKSTTVTILDSGIITNDVLDKDVAFCPSGGTFTIVMTERPASIVHLAISCNGGANNENHD